jgi:intraflagellar transport protein 140
LVGSVDTCKKLYGSPNFFIFFNPGWDSGEIYLFSNQQCTKVDSSHNSPVHLAEFSSQGSSLITADKSGTIVGWKTDGGGGTRLELLFHHELKDQLTGLSFCPSASSESSLNLTGLARAAVAGDEKALDLFSSWRPNMERMQAASSGENLNAYAGSANGVIYYLNENGSCMEVLQVRWIL